MSTQIVLDPALSISAEEFARWWNESPFAAEHGQMSVTENNEEAAVSFFGTELALALITAVAITIPTQIMMDFVKEYLKQKYLTPSGTKTTVITYKKPDGTPLLIVTKEEK